MKNYVKIKDNDGLIKDLSTGAILNTDRTAILRHEKIKREAEKEVRRENEINNLKSEISEIKQLLQMLVKKDWGINGKRKSYSNSIRKYIWRLAYCHKQSFKHNKPNKKWNFCYRWWWYYLCRRFSWYSNSKFYWNGFNCCRCVQLHRNRHNKDR